MAKDKFFDWVLGRTVALKILLFVGSFGSAIIYFLVGLIAIIFEWSIWFPIVCFPLSVIIFYSSFKKWKVIREYKDGEIYLGQFVGMTRVDEEDDINGTEPSENVSDGPSRENGQESTGRHEGSSTKVRRKLFGNN